MARGSVRGVMEDAVRGNRTTSGRAKEGGRVEGVRLEERNPFVCSRNDFSLKRKEQAINRIWNTCDIHVTLLDL